MNRKQAKKLKVGDKVYALIDCGQEFRVGNETFLRPRIVSGIIKSSSKAFAETCELYVTLMVSGDRDYYIATSELASSRAEANVMLDKCLARVKRDMYDYIIKLQNSLALERRCVNKHMLRIAQMRKKLR